MLFQNYFQLTLLYFQGMFYRVNHKYKAFTVGEREREREREEHDHKINYVRSIIWMVAESI